MKHIRILFIGMFLIQFTFCNKNSLTYTNTTNSPQIEELRLQTGFVVFKAIQNSDFLSLIVDESKKKIGGDSDVLLVSILDLKLSNGILVSHLFDSIGSDFFGISSISEKIKYQMPLEVLWLSDTFVNSSNNASINIVTPKVAIRNIELIRSQSKIQFVGDDGLSLGDAFQLPSFPFIVLKESESLVFVKTGSVSDLAKSYDIELNNSNSVFKNQIGEYYLINGNSSSTSIESISNTTSISQQGALGPSCSRATDYTQFDSRARSAFEKGIYNPICPENNATVRDFIYYGIDPTTGVNQGPLNYSYREYITSIKCNNLNARTRMDDIGEGSILDFDVIIYTADADPIFPLKKRLSIPKTQFFVTDAVDLTPKPYDLVKNIGTSLQQPVELAVWNFKRQGDIWKFAIFEYDPGQTFTDSRTVTATLGTNFTIGDEKVGGKFGLSATVSSTKTISITTTNTSDDLGEAVLYWCDPVIKEAFTPANGIWCGRPSNYGRGGRQPYIGRSGDISTGIIELTVEPRFKN
ncbi:hypothetical protein [Phnomibacter sp. MR]|uniref:hypothetical protein n=1 Tax=Phnomibacter sp. MR TaxID=3042318 RepID=UPI003A80F32F